MSNFFKELANAERDVLGENSYFKNADGNLEPYAKVTQQTLIKLVELTSSGRLFDEAEVAYYISRHFRLGASQLTRFWNNTHEIKKNANTFRSQISTASQKYTNLFGTNIYEIFTSQNFAEIKHIDKLLDFLKIPDMYMDEMVFWEIADFCNGYEGADFQIGDCVQEIKFLRSLVRCRLIPMLESLDIDKLRFIKYVLDKPIVNHKDLKLNKEKAELVNALGIPAIVLGKPLHRKQK